MDSDRLEQLLIDADYDETERRFLCDGFRLGFDLGYRGPEDRQDTSDNIPFTVGNHLEM